MSRAQSGGAGEKDGGGGLKGKADTCICCKYHLCAKYNPSNKGFSGAPGMDLYTQSKAELFIYCSVRTAGRNMSYRKLGLIKKMVMHIEFEI